MKFIVIITEIRQNIVVKLFPCDRMTRVEVVDDETDEEDDNDDDDVALYATESALISEPFVFELIQLS